MLEAIAVVAGLEDVTVKGETVQQCRGHLRITEDIGPFREAQVSRDDDAGALIELAQQVEQQSTTGLAEPQIAQFIKHDQIGMHKTDEPSARACRPLSPAPIP